MSTTNPTITPAEAGSGAGANLLDPAAANADTVGDQAAAPSRQRVQLSSDQRRTLKQYGRTGALVKSALQTAQGAGFLLPLILGRTTAFLSRKLRLVPMINLLVPVYGGIATVFAVVIGVCVVTPITFLIAVPAKLIRVRPRVREDLERGTAVKASGTFPVSDRKTGGSIACGEVSLSVSAAQMEGIRPHLRSQGNSSSFAGSITYAEHSKVLLAAQN